MENKIKLNVEEQILRISIPTDNGVMFETLFFNFFLEIFTYRNSIIYR